MIKMKKTKYLAALTAIAIVLSGFLTYTTVSAAAGTPVTA